MIIDTHMNDIIDKNENMTIPYYLMASYAYYKDDDPILTDGAYDALAKRILENFMFNSINILMHHYTFIFILIYYRRPCRLSNIALVRRQIKFYTPIDRYPG